MSQNKLPKNNLSFMAYNFTQIDDKETELNIYDEIANKRSYDWWNDKEGTQVTPDLFKNELDNVITPEITVRINSGGGEVMAANTIAVAIQEARNKGKKIKCKIDGMCASAAVQIAMACESITIHSSAYMMIHNPLTFMFGYVQEQDLKETSNFLNKIKKGIMNAYVKKTGKSEDEISKMMDETTWMTGDEAVEMGFADSIMFEEDDEVINRISMVAMNSVYDIPRDLKKVLDEKKGEKDNMEIQTVINSVIELEKAYPELVNQVRTEAINGVSHEEAVKTAVDNERARMKAIDEMAGKVDAKLLNKAKYETFDTAEKVALNAIKNDNFINTGVINAMQNESVVTNQVGVVPTETTEKDVKNEASEIAKAYFKKSGKE